MFGDLRVFTAYLWLFLLCGLNPLAGGWDSAQQDVPVRAVRGGFHACVDGPAWAELERHRLEGDVRGFNGMYTTFEARGICWLTRPGEMVRLEPSDLAGTVRVVRLEGREAQQKRAPPRPAFLSVAALVDK